MEVSKGGEVEAPYILDLSPGFSRSCCWPSPSRRMYISSTGELRRWNLLKGNAKARASTRAELIGRVLEAVGQDMKRYSEVQQLARVDLEEMGTRGRVPRMWEISAISQSLDVVRNRVFVSYQRERCLENDGRWKLPDEFPS